MIKKRKILSLLTALSITATAFAGMAIPASAETKQIVAYTFESGESDIWEESGSHTAQYATDIVADTTLNSNVLHTALDNQTGGRTVTLSLPETVTPETDVVNVSFDWYSMTTGAKDSTDTILVDSSGNQIFKISDFYDDGTIYFAGENLTLARGWYKVSATLDFETKQVITITFTANGANEAAATVSNTAFISDSASDIKGLYLAANRTNNLTLDWRIDNFTVSSVTGEHYKATITVQTSDDEPVADATVTLGGVEYTTDESGQILTKLPIGEYEYTVHKAGYEATAEAQDDATGKITVTDQDVTETVTYSKQVYTPVPGTVTLSGGQLVMTAPHSLDSTTSAAYTVKVLDQRGVEIDDADIAWSILPTGSETADDYVKIENGVITVLKGFDAGDTNVKNFTVTATATKNSESMNATATIDISDYLFYEPGVDSSSYGSTNMAYNTTGGATGTETYIATPDEKGRTDTITLPDPITFTAGTAQLLSFKTTVQNAEGYTWQRTVSVVDSNDTSIVAFGYISLNIGDSATATWDSSTSTFATTWGSIPSLTTWVDVTVLFKTNAQGETKVILTVGDNEYELGATTATGISAITLYEGLNNVNRYALLKDIVISEVDVTGVEIDGPTEFSTVDDATITKEYEVDAMVIDDGETFTWSTDIDGATITPSDDTLSATLTVPDTVKEGGTISLESSASTDEKPKKAELEVTIEPAEIVSAEISGSATLETTEGTAEYTVSNVTDQFGADITDYVTAAWSLAAEASGTGDAAFEVTADKADTAVAIKAVYENGALKSVETEDVALSEGTNNVTITADVGAKVMLWNSIEGMEPLAAAKTAAAVEEEVTNAEIDSKTGVVTITDDGNVVVTATITNNDVEYPFTKDVKIATFSVVADADGNSTVVDISSLTTDDAITGYQVTTATSDGVQVAQTEVALADVTDGKITVDTTDADKVEIAPIFEGVMNTEYNIPADRYNITVTANNGARTDVYANDQMIINNINQGTDNWVTYLRTIAASTDYDVEDVVIAEGSVTFNYQDDKSSESTITAVKFVKAPSIVTRAQRIYVIGDSLVAKYYGDAAEGEEGLVRTGWGEKLQDYIKDAKVTNLGNSGAWAEGMYGDAFTNVRASAQAGDIVIWESGYNDRTNSTVDAMTEAINKAIAECYEMGVDFYLVTPNASYHDYKEDVVWASNIRDIANDTDNAGKVTLIDLSAESYKFLNNLYGTLSDTERAAIMVGTTDNPGGIYNNATWDESGSIAGDKGLHSTGNAANCWAAVVAQGLLGAHSDIVNTDYTYTFSDGTNTININAATINVSEEEEDDNTENGDSSTGDGDSSSDGDSSTGDGDSGDGDSSSDGDSTEGGTE